MYRGKVGYLEPGALAVFGAADCNVQVIEIIASTNARMPLTVWVRCCGGNSVDPETDQDISNNVVWWP